MVLREKKNPYSCNSLRMGNKNEFKFKKNELLYAENKKDRRCFVVNKTNAI
jgi:hypothetical protein